VIGDDRIFFSGGYKSGCVMVRLTGQGADIEPKEIFRLEHSVFGAEQQTPILYRGHIYGVIPSGELACLDLEGNRLWTSGKAKRFGLGPYLLADGLLFLLQDRQGMLHVVEATPAGYRELASAHVVEGHEAWGPIAMAGGRMILRNLTEVVCLQVPTE
jgi:outer membrane protein assembly factor BamB